MRVSTRRRIGEHFFRHVANFKVCESGITSIVAVVRGSDDRRGTVGEIDFKAPFLVRLVFHEEEALLPAVVDVFYRLAVLSVDIYRRDGGRVERGEGGRIGGARLAHRDARAREPADVRRFQPEGKHQIRIGSQREGVVFERRRIRSAVRTQKHEQILCSVEGVILKVVLDDSLHVFILIIFKLV